MTLKQRYIPEGATEHLHPHGLGVAYRYQRVDMRKNTTLYCVRIFKGKQSQPLVSEAFRDDYIRDQRILKVFKAWDESATYKASIRAEYAKPHTLQVGDVLSYSWGYDQTNVEFFQVLAVTAHSATLIELAQETVPQSTLTHGMADTRTPDPTKFIGERFQAKINGRNCACGKRFRHGNCSKWDGKPQYCSWYA